MTVLIIGGSGFLGTELVRQAAFAGRRPAATFHSRPGDDVRATWHHLDLRDPIRLEKVLDTVAPAVLINATSGGADWAVTAEGGIRLAQAAASRSIRLVHVSSDAVFSGTGRDWYDESCLPDPLTPYGAAKAAAETAVRLLCSDAAVVRTSLIIGHGRSEHEQLAHALAAGTRQGALFTDDIRCPVHVEDLAAALWEITQSDAAGVFHLAGPDALSRHVPCQVHLFRFCGVLWGPETQKSRPGVKVGRGGSRPWYWWAHLFNCRQFPAETTPLVTVCGRQWRISSSSLRPPTVKPSRLSIWNTPA
ncbi:sugar nucleotide-binding protein [Streptomyces sp. NPDC046275]|uniref:SDR family oxidoreductase n=1 Tax=Streptomyces sp. NPDC046275 TaxID=3157201 RepID=UPI0033D1D738